MSSTTIDITESDLKALGFDDHIDLDDSDDIQEAVTVADRSELVAGLKLVGIFGGLICLTGLLIWLMYF